MPQKGLVMGADIGQTRRPTKLGVLLIAVPCFGGQCNTDINVPLIRTGTLYDTQGTTCYLLHKAATHVIGRQKKILE